MTTQVSIVNDQASHRAITIKTAQAEGPDVNSMVIQPGGSLTTHVWEGVSLVIEEVIPDAT